jgi:sugar phosphate isomerase/epimerase
MLREIRDLGFQYAELSHGTRISLLPGIIEAVDAGEIKDFEPAQFLPAADGGHLRRAQPLPVLGGPARERELAERYTVKTIEFAARVKAPVVVLHSGSIDMKNYTDKLLDLVGRGQKETPKYAKLCAELDEKREAKKEPFVERVMSC